MDTIAMTIAIYSVPVFALTALAVFIGKLFGRKLSPYLVFGIADIVCMIAVIAVALWDILTPGGDLNGLFGQVLLMMFVPTAVALLIGDIILWRKSKNRKKSQ
ncbi:MAG: hypothetical protein J6F31_06470 [Oscillospiraceae bacterium]|nr:hypothetical protein [Oscillospiraceae bacterium]